jgi:hypothetical protein
MVWSKRWSWHMSKCDRSWRKNQSNKLLYTWTFSTKYVNFVLLNLNRLSINKFYCPRFWGPEYDWNGSRFGEVYCFSIVFSMAFPTHSGLWPLIQFRSHFSQMLGLLGRVSSPSQGRYLNTGQHKHRINSHNTDIHALSGIPTHDPSVRASEVSSCLRPRGHCDRRQWN